MCLHFVGNPKAEALAKFPPVNWNGKNPYVKSRTSKYFRQEGFEGKAEGEKQKAIEIAKNLMKLNLNIETICEATGLTSEEVKELIKSCK